MADNSIFSKEVLDELTVSDGNSNKVPLTVLGKTFANDDERREYFREELRKKLPELKKIEGYPIGEDDDIVNLSDPPYYTACPNPWINDFIKEWEADKTRLQAEGKRTADFEVKEPYSSDVSEGKNNPIYMAHAYHTKVPHPAIMRYILHYTQPGDIVFDGFCGTGMTGVAANMCGDENEVKQLNIDSNIRSNVGVRHSVCSDLSPIASLIAASYNLSFDFKAFRRKAEAILEQVESELGWMYETEVDGRKAKVNYTIWSDVFECPNCQHNIILWNPAVDLEKGIIKDVFVCPHCGQQCSKQSMSVVWESKFDSILGEVVHTNKVVPVRVNYTLRRRGEQNVSNYDLKLISKIDEIDCSNLWTERMPEGDESRRNDRIGVTHSHQFYTKRNYIYLSRVFKLIGNDDLLKNWFTSALQRTTRQYKFTLDRKFGILAGTFYIPSLNVELNPYGILKRKIKDFEAMAYRTRGNGLISISSAVHLDTMADSSIDYMFVDPPFGANIMYSELSSIWESWLKVKTDNKDEAIINKTQHKTLFDYQKLMNCSLKEFYRVLKPGKWLTMEFSNTSAAVWNSIQNALQGVGFIVANVSALDKQQGSFKAVTTPTAVKQDLIISCFKPTSELTELFEKSSDKADKVWEFVEELLEHLPVHIKKDNSTTAVVERSPKILFDRLIAYYVQKGYPVPLDAADFQKGLKERFVERDGMFFTTAQANEYAEKKKDTVEFNNLFVYIGSEAEGIEWLKRKLAESPRTYSEIQPEWMQDLASPKKGDSLPELMQILDENFIKEPDGRWRLPNIQDDVDKSQLRTKALLREFKLYVEQASKPKAKIKEVRVEAVRAGFKDCYIRKDFQTIVMVGDKIPQNLLTEDEILLQFYDIAVNHI